MSHGKVFSFLCALVMAISLFLGSSGLALAASPVLFVRPTSLTQTSAQCRFDGPPSNTFHCAVSLGETAKSSGSITWSSSSSLSGVAFSPASGTLNPGQSLLVKITAIPCAASGTSGSFTFSGQSGVQAVSVSWSCTLPPTLTATPKSLNPTSTKCALDSTLSATYKCTLSLGETTSSPLSANWSASSSLSGVSITPSSGMLSPGGSVPVTIDLLPCKNGSITFSGKEGELPLRVTWSCTPPGLSVSPTSLSQQSTNCTASGNSYQCTVTLSESTSSKAKVNWAGSSTLSGVSFSPASGTLSPGQSTTVTISAIPCQNGSFSFSGSGGTSTVSVSWSCAPPPILTVSPTSLDPTNTTNCALDSTLSATYKCTVSLGETSGSQGNANWTSSSSLSGVSFTPSSGTLSPGGTASVTIDLIPCQNGSFTFSGNEGETPVVVTWSCTPPTLTVSPTTLNNGMCGGAQNASQCTVTLGESSGSQGSVNWAASSGLSGVSFSPASGTLSPGQTATITISAIPCQAGSFSFAGSGGASTVAVSWTCANWDMYGYDSQNTRSNALESGLSASTVSGLILDWQKNLGLNGPSSPAVVNNMVYINATPWLYAYNFTTGALVWQIYQPGNFSSPAVANGIVYDGGDGTNSVGGLIAINASTGAVLWHVANPSPTYVPTVANGVVYVGINDGNNGPLSLNAFDANTGALLWSKAGGSLFAPAVDNGMVFSAGRDGTLYALDAATGALKWSYSPGSMSSAPAVGNGEVFVSGGHGLAALNESSGAVVWETGPNTSHASSVAYANGTVYAVTGYISITLQALDAATGAVKWSTPIGNNVDTYSTPAIANGVVYVGMNDHNIYAFDASSGTQVWSYTTGSSINASPAVVNGVLYVGSDDGNLYAFHLSGSAP